MQGQTSTPERTTNRTSTDQEESDTWPWGCVDCGTTIYHDGAFCQSCESAYRRRRTYPESDTDDGFLAWIRNQTTVGLAAKTTAVAGIELGLTTFWLQTLLRRSVELGVVLPIVP